MVVVERGFSLRGHCDAGAEAPLYVAALLKTRRCVGELHAAAEIALIRSQKPAVEDDVSCESAGAEQYAAERSQERTHWRWILAGRRVHTLQRFGVSLEILDLGSSARRDQCFRCQSS